MQTTAHFGHIHETIIAELQKARQSVYVAVAWFTDRGLFKRFANGRQRASRSS